MRNGSWRAALRVASGSILGMSLCSMSHAASVLPEYFFNGPVAFSSGTDTLAVKTGAGGAEIIGSQGLPSPFAVIPTNMPGSNIAGSEIVLSLNLGTVTDSNGTTTATFTTPVGYEAALYLGNGSGGTQSSPVLTGSLTDMEVSGGDGNNLGVLTGLLHPNGGSAFSFFSNPSDVIALEFNLTTNFAKTMYQSSFSGQINGQVESTSAAPVPLPAALPLLVSGLGLLGAAARRRRQSLAAL